MRTLAALTLTALALATGFPARAEAQIYSWRDAQGRLVLSDRRPASVTRTFGVRETATIRSTRRAEPATTGLYEDLITYHSRRNGLRPDLVRAVIQTESAFNPYARSHKGALGLMQLMPDTAFDLGVSNPLDPEQNIAGGTAYLRRLLDRYGHNEELALAAYNAGPRTVDRYGAIPPYRETKNYVARIRNRTGLATRSPRTRVYRTVDVIDGREVPRYSNVRPSAR